MVRSHISSAEPHFPPSLGPRSNLTILLRLIATVCAHGGRVQPGGEGFVSQFEGKAAKPGMRSKQKHQITSLVYDLAQKEGDILERQGKNFQTKKQTWGKYGWA